MVNFSRYYVQYIKLLLANFVKFWATLWKAISNAFFFDIVDYFKLLINNWNSFNVLDWLFEIIAIIANVALFGFIILRLYQLLRRYIRFVKKELEKDELLEEIANLNLKVAQLVDEKNKIYALKVSPTGLGQNQLGGGYVNGAGAQIPTNGGDLYVKSINVDGNVDEKGSKTHGSTTSRFVKLIAVDKKYESENTTIVMEPEDMVSLPQLVDRFINYAASQLHLYYDHKVIRTFFAGLATSKILILEGISGTGKTSLPYAMGKFFKNPSAIISVQPSWRDRAEMIGYLNEFTKRFNETDFLKALYETTYREDMNFIVLDEMNLARVEYYFAEFLSIMEMPNVSEWLIDIVPDQTSSDPVHLQDGKILVPQNVWFIGTANRDDSTFTITDKVYDRAVSIEMNNRAEYIDVGYTENINMSYEYFHSLCLKGQDQNPISTKNLERLQKLDEFIADKFKITFGNRIMKQIKLFVPAYVACGGTELDGLDYIIVRKIFRKFETLNIAFLTDEIAQLISLLGKLFGKGTFNESIRYLNELVKNA